MTFSIVCYGVNEQKEKKIKDKNAKLKSLKQIFQDESKYANSCMILKWEYTRSENIWLNIRIKINQSVILVYAFI